MLEYFSIKLVWSLAKVTVPEKYTLKGFFSIIMNI